MKIQLLKASLFFLFIAVFSCSKRENPSPEPAVEPHILRLGKILGQHFDPTKTHFELMTAESAETYLISSQQVDILDVDVKRLGFAAAVLRYDDEDSGNFTVYTWYLDRDKLQLTIIFHSPQNEFRKTYYWICK